MQLLRFLSEISEEQGRKSRDKRERLFLDDGVCEGRKMKVRFGTTAWVRRWLAGAAICRIRQSLLICPNVKDI
jgi:hypothetical protein